MRALIMAGGAGSRLGRGEKPLISICDRPMISYVIDAFRSAMCEPVVVVSQKTPMTANWCRAHNIAVVRTGGVGYIEDMVAAVLHLEEEGAVFISVSDIPCISPKIVEAVREQYETCEKVALSTWVPVGMAGPGQDKMPYHQTIRGIDSCPAGVNILRGDRIGSEQDEFVLLLDEPGLALNVNTAEDLDRAETFIRALNPPERRPNPSHFVPKV